MKRGRLTELLVAHAATEGTSVGVALRQSGGPAAIAGASQVDAGQLLAGLRTARVEAGLAQLAEAWPAAADAARRRLDRLPDLRVKQAQLQEVLAYLFLVAGLQLLAALAMSSPLLADVTTALGPPAEGGLRWLFVLAIVLSVVEVALVVASGLVSRRPGLVPGWGGARRRARGAALAAAMQEAGAPAGLQAQVLEAAGGIAPSFATAAELELVLETALASEQAGHARLIAWVRGAGLGALAAAAAITTVAVYQTIAGIVS